MNDKIKILIVDDEPDILSLVKDVLDYGKLVSETNIFTASNGLEGFEIIKKTQPDIVITDMMMPKMNGSVLIENVSKLNIKIPFIVMSGYADFEMAVSLFKYNVFSLIRKPFDLDEMNNTVQRCIDKILIEQQNQYYLEKLTQSEKLSSIGLLAAGIAHEINNPNAFIKGNLELLLKYFNIILPHVSASNNEDTAIRNKIKLALDNIEPTISSAMNGSERISKIVSGLTSFSRGSAHQVKTSTKKLFSEALTLTQHRHKIHQLKMDISENISEISVNEQEVIQVLMNLIVNAIDAIEMSYSDKNKSGQIQLRAYDDLPNHQQIWEISDNGPGMSEEVLGKIFLPFFTTKPTGKGTGLGLYISAKNISLNGGMLTCKSTVGMGTQFIITFPIQ